MLSGFFGVLALLLATIGLYGIVAHGVHRRRAEIGLRLALGARRRQVIGMILGETTRLVVLGVSIGLALSLGVTGLLSSFLYEVTPRDPRTLVFSALALIFVAGVAALIPAHRAARGNPVAALREG
jgi:ABC-type antimicrobial peptide transport system permease subunit